MFRRILVANDGSQNAGKALQAAIELAVTHGAELHSISVEEGLPRYAGTIDEVEDVKAQLNGAMRKINQVAVALAAERGLELQWEVEAGHEVEVKPISSDELKRPARRPENSVLDSSKLAEKTGYEFPAWRQSLRAFMARL